jgi:uncharacterized membrane protein YukC
VFVGFELSKLNKKNPSHYQAMCPACRAVNKVSVAGMQEELDQVSGEIQQMVAEYEEQKAQAKAEQQAKAKEKMAAKQKPADTRGKQPKKSRKRLKA